MAKCGNKKETTDEMERHRNEKDEIAGVRMLGSGGCKGKRERQEKENKSDNERKTLAKP